jgi:hypothetical protein
MGSFPKAAAQPFVAVRSVQTQRRRALHGYRHSQIKFALLGPFALPEDDEVVRP